ncbi:hypothetical protein FOCC_FOCC001959 [Frankliniella occidentalis]|nr:hypothetical protein FOCC_FOCC001959 [Frankliniella occidentalis]
MCGQTCPNMTFCWVRVLMLLLAAHFMECANVTQAQVNEVYDRTATCLVNLPNLPKHAVNPWVICDFRGTEALGNEKNDIKDVPGVVVACLNEYGYSKKDVTEAKKCLKKALAKPL